jgi:hypothetical protein
MPGFREGDWDRCRHEFREHCIKAPWNWFRKDTERICWLDLEALTLTLL